MEITYENEIKKEYRNVENWLDQFFNIGASMLWAVGSWLMLSISSIGFLCIIFALYYDGRPVVLTDLQSDFKGLVVCVFSVASLVVLLFGLPKKLRNVFENKAWDRLSRYEAIKNQFDSRVTTTDSLLLTYGLITQDDIETRQRNKTGDEVNNG